MATLAQIKQQVVAVVKEASQTATDFTPTKDNRLGLIDRIGRTIIVDGDATIDRLPELNGPDMPTGRVIQEYFLGFIAPTDRNKADGIGTRAYPEKKKTYFDYPLKEQKFKTSIAYEDLEKAVVSADEAGSLVARVLGRRNDSRDLFRYNEKKQLIANLIAKAGKATNKTQLITEIAKPVDATTGEAFIKAVKNKVRDAGFRNTDNLSGELAKGASGLTLYVTKGIMPSIEVDTEAGAFNRGKLATGCEIKELDDFGNADAGVYAILVDTRGIQLCKNYQFTRNQPLADPGAYDEVRHFSATGFISGYSFVHVFKVPA